MEEMFDKVLDLGQQLLQKITGVTVRGNWGKALVYYFNGATRTLGAMKTLYESDFFEEGFCLARFLLESTIDLDYMKMNKEERAKQFFEFDMLKTNEMADLQQTLNVRASSQERYKISLEFKKKTRWSQIPIERMLSEIYGTDEKTKNSELLLYKHCCTFSHPSALTLGAEVFFDDKDYPVRKAYKEESKATLPPFSCQLVLKIYHIIDVELGLGCGSQINQINEEIARFVQQGEQRGG